MDGDAALTHTPLCTITGSWFQATLNYVENAGLLLQLHFPGSVRVEFYLSSLFMLESRDQRCSGQISSNNEHFPPNRDQWLKMLPGSGSCCSSATGSLVPPPFYGPGRP
ncbi:hypothetical protein GOODEAATRI_018134 [Goodea atripinnis]|uniref:Uncharacterized protein n=1 Tax=Goodea atripinnis TaxID=208336 RepID=A0ABV0PPQ0_9TELE